MVFDDDVVFDGDDEVAFDRDVVALNHGKAARGGEELEGIGMERQENYERYKHGIRRTCIDVLLL